jgi:penicillin amidase
MCKSERFSLRHFFLSIFPLSLLLISIQPALAEDFNFPGLGDTVTVTEDQYGVPTIRGKSELDVSFVQGYIHARDRFFQMDFSRKLAQGRGAELVGEAALANDVQLRTLGLGRAALATWQALDGDIKGILQAYANGVNAWLNSNPLPPEYVGLELTKVEPWTALDSVSFYKLVAWQLSFDLDEIPETIRLGAYQAAGEIVGFEGVALFNDVSPYLPPDGRVTVPGFIDSIGGIGQVPAKSRDSGAVLESENDPMSNMLVSDTTLELARILEEKFSQSPLLKTLLTGRDKDKGSNEWAISGEFTESGYPIVANDPHLPLDTPPTMHEVNLVYDQSEDSYSVSGIQFPGAAGVIQGCNDSICWGSTVNPMDVNDVFQDKLQTNALGLPTHTVHSGEAEPLNQVFQTWYVNVIGDEVPDNMVRAPVGIDAGGITFISPRRNNGPVLAFFDGDALFSQYTGWGPTFETKFVYEMNKARDLDEFKAALQYFDMGSQNWIYGDVEGNIGYFTSAENPIRSDMAAGTLDGGVPPSFIRDGSGALNHEWLPVSNPQPNQATPFEIMPFDEMPQVVNPPSGYIANSNSDPVGATLDGNPWNQVRPGGNGIYYLNYYYADYRQGRADRVMKSLTEQDKPVTVQDLMDLQANTQMLDAELTLPTLLQVMSQVPVPPDSMMEQALGVLSTWDYSAPTGLAEGWDAGDDPNMAIEPDETEIRNSAAATVFAAWRSRLVQNTIDATLTAIGLSDYLPNSTVAQRAFTLHLLAYPQNQGVGQSGINFFSAGLPETVVGSLQQALDLLASDEFAPAFANSTDIMDYRWGKLHRIVFDHPLGVDPFNIPNGGGFTDLAPDLPGLARQGGFEAVDASSHSARADGLNEFMFGSGPNRRFVGEMTPDGVVGYNTIPGGQSGVFLHPNYSSQLPLWLTNSYHPLALGSEDGDAVAVTSYSFGPVMPASATKGENNND